MRYVRIKIDGNKSYLTYNRGMISEMVLVEKLSYIDRAPLVRAYSKIRSLVQVERANLRNAGVTLEIESRISNRGVGHWLKKLMEKRKSRAKIALKSKKPVNLSKHVGVEIEFISKSDRNDIALDLAMQGVEQYCELKGDGSVKGDRDEDFECQGDCREECDCAYCSEVHTCDDQEECDRRTINNGDRRRSQPNDTWVVRDSCDECETETVEEENEDGTTTTREISNCLGHCDGHSCNGYDDHSDYDCECECDCSGGSESGHEIAIVAKSKLMPEILVKVCSVLKKHGAYVNNTCGLHVHVDARGRDHMRMFSNLVKSQGLLYSMVPVSRYDNTYCKPNKSNDMECYDGRYWGVNPASYNEHKTIEVRLHSGTIDSVKIINWITLLQKLAYSKSLGKIQKLTDLTNSKMKFSPELIEYIKERVIKFKQKNGSYHYRQFEIDTNDSELALSIAA